ncbi:hypothetical protein IWW48_006076 [Coemansia sp. RSA 1200]|nr:hypothetical protein IWW48_006076 [Coemansia sp. RSA 1200]
MPPGNDENSDASTARSHNETAPLLQQSPSEASLSPAPASATPHGSSDSSPTSEHEAWIASSQPASREAPRQRGLQRLQQLQQLRQRQDQGANAHSQPFSRKWWFRRIRYYVPIVGWLTTYSLGNLATDIKAGFMVACLLVPQTLSYSALTHLPPAYGLYAALVPALVYAMLGTSRHLSMGPEALISVLTGTLVKGQIKHLYAAYSPNIPPPDAIDRFAAGVSCAVALATGLFTFALGIFRFGFLDSMISESSLRGFISGTAIFILVGQTRIVLGIPPSTSVHSTPLNDLKYILTHLHQTHAATAVVSLASMALLLLLRVAKRRFKTTQWLQLVPDTLVVIIAATTASWATELNATHGVGIFGRVDGGLPKPAIPRIPAYAESKDIVSSAITITMIGVVESVIVAREYASRNHYAVSSNRELVALGMSNIVGSAFGAYPAFGSLSRSKLNDRAQAKSQISGIVATALVLVSLLGLLPYLYHLPLSVLSAIIVDAVGSLLSATPGAIAFLFGVRAWADLFLLLFICMCSIVSSVETGILLAVVISLIMVIKRSNTPRIRLLGRSAVDIPELRPISNLAPFSNSSRCISFGSFVNDAQTHNVRQENVSDSEGSPYDSDQDAGGLLRPTEGVLIVRVEEPLYFANAGQLHARLNRLEMFGDLSVHPSEAPQMKPTRAVVFDLVGMADIDGSALEILLNIVREYGRRGVRAAFARVCDDVRTKFGLSGMAEAGAEYEFEDIHSALLHVERQLTVSIAP